MNDYLAEAIDAIEYKFNETDTIFLMGRIGHLLIIKDVLRKKGCSVAGIIDNDVKKQGVIVDGLEIFAPDTVLERIEKSVVILIYSPKYSKKMVDQCESYGLREGNNLFVIDKPTLERNKHLVYVGLSLYETLKDKYGESVTVFYADCPRGDFYLLSLFIKKYCRNKRILDYVIVSHSQGLKELAESLDIIPFEEISVLSSRGLAMAWCFLGRKDINVVPLTIWQGEFRFNPCLIRQSERFSFIDTFRYMVFGLDEGELPLFEDFSDDDFDVEEYAAQRGLPKGKTVIISPFSYSLQSLSNEKWVAIAELIKRKGYTVAVNTGKMGEENFIPETISVELDFTKIFKLMEYSEYVVGMRSGFFDITCRAKCNRVILYPKALTKKNDWNSTDIDFCSLKKMGLCEDAYEIETDLFENTLESIDKIIPPVNG